MANTFEKVYSKKPNLYQKGTLEELRTAMIQDREKYGPEVFKYLF